MPHTVLFATAGIAGLFAILRGGGRTVILIGQGTAMEKVHAGGKALLSEGERDAVRAVFGLPSVAEDPSAMTEAFMVATWDHGLVPCRYRYEEVMGGELPQVAVGEVAGVRTAS
jgi:hypothetical protein